MCLSIQALPRWQPPAARPEESAGALRHGCAVGGHRAGSRPGRAALDVAVAAATQGRFDSMPATARAGRSDRT